jgi:hypothetical protein
MRGGEGGEREEIKKKGVTKEDNKQRCLKGDSCTIEEGERKDRSGERRKRQRKRKRSQ